MCGTHCENALTSSSDGFTHNVPNKNACKRGSPTRSLCAEPVRDDADVKGAATNSYIKVG